MADFRVIEGGDERRNPEQDIAEQELADALRDAAANVLRIIRGAGKPYSLIKQFGDVIRAVSDFKEAAGHWPPSDMLARMLKLDDEVSEIYHRSKSGQIRQESIDRWKQDSTFERLYAERVIQRGVLQIIASKLLGQTAQASAGVSEMHQGIRDMIEAQEEHRNYVDANSSIKMVRKKSDHEPASRPSKPGQRDE
jgi:hypothetical protein